MSITELGWINCDRFISDPSPKVNCNILVENQDNTTFYFVFEGINSVIQASSTTNGFQFISLPMNRRVKLIGLRIVKGSPQLIVKYGTVSSFNNYKADFTPIVEDELSTLLVSQ